MVKHKLYNMDCMQGYSSLAFLGMVKRKVYYYDDVPGYSSLAFLGMVKHGSAMGALSFSL